MLVLLRLELDIGKEIMYTLKSLLEDDAWELLFPIKYDLLLFSTPLNCVFLILMTFMLSCV